MRRLLLDSAVALVMLGWRVLQELLDCQRSQPIAPPPAREEIPAGDCPTWSLEAAEETVEVWEPQAEWRQRWDALRP